MEETSNQEKKKRSKIGYFIYTKFIVLIQIPLNLLIAYFTKTYIEVCISMISFVTFRYDFPKTYHCNKVISCMQTTSYIYWLYSILIIDLNINISIFLHILSGLCIGFFAYLVQDIKDRMEFNIFKSRREKIIKVLDNNTSKEHIIEYCKSKGLKEDVAKTIDLYLFNTIDETCNILYISPNTLDYRINKFLKSKNI